VCFHTNYVSIVYHIQVIIAALRNTAGIIFSSCGFLLCFFFFSLPNLSGRFCTRCGLSTNLECRSEMCYTQLARNTGRKNDANITICASSHNFVGLFLCNKGIYQQADRFLRPDCAPVPNAPSSKCPELRSLHAAALPVQSEYPAESCAAAAVPLPESPQGQTSKSIPSVSFVRTESNFFTIHRRHRRKKSGIRIVKFEFCDF